MCSEPLYQIPESANSRPVYYSILELFGHRSQYISIKFPLHKPSENVLLTETGYCLQLYSKCFKGMADCAKQVFDNSIHAF